MNKTRKKKVLAVLLCAMSATLLLGGVGCEEKNPTPSPPFSDSSVISPETTDKTAPVISKGVADREAEIGFYADLQKDLDTVVAKDNVANELSIKAESIAFNGKTTDIASNAEILFLSKEGEYTVTYSVSDFSGNSVSASYKLTVKDTVAPVLDAPAVFLAWAENGKIAIPQINVIDIAKTVCAVTAVDENNMAVTVENGYLLTDNAAKYTLTYTATDEAGNKSDALSIKLVVNERPIISDFSDEDEASLWGSIARGENGKLRVQSSSEEVSLSFIDNFAFNDWTDYNRFAFTVENERATDLNVSLQAKVDNTWVNLLESVVKPAMYGVDSVTATTVTCGVWLEDYSVTNVQGLRIVLKSNGGVQASLDDIRLENGIKPQTPETSDLSGVAAGTYVLDGNETQSITFNGVSFGNNNALTYKVWSSTEGSISVGVRIDQETVYAERRLSQGWNDIFRLPTQESENDNILAGQFSAIVLKNNEAYPITLCIDSLSLTTKTQCGLEDYMGEVGEYGVIYGEDFHLPAPFLLDARYYSDLTISLVNDNNVVIVEGLSIGDVLSATGEGAIESGVYDLRYEFKDCFGEEKSVNISLTIQKDVLSISLSDALLYAGDIQLPEPILSSEKYSESQLKNASIEKYYRRVGLSKWYTADGDLQIDESDAYEFRYVVTLDGVRREKTFVKYVHKNEYSLDFEEETAAGNYLTIYDYNAEGEKVYADYPSRFLHDGGYYDYGGIDFDVNYTLNRFEVSNAWSKSGSYSLHCDCLVRGWCGILIEPVIAKGEKINAVSFWLKSDASYTATVEAGRGDLLPGGWAKNGWLTSEPFEVKAGEHFYTVFFEGETDLGICAFIINTMFAVGLSFDDIEFSYINRFSLADIDYADHYDLTLPASFERPTAISEFYSEEELSKGEWALTYSINGGAEKPIKANEQGRYEVKFSEAGEVMLHWYFTIDGKTFTQSKRIMVGCLDLEAEMSSFVKVGNEVQISAPVSTGVELSGYQVVYAFGESNEWTPLEAVGEGYSFIPQKEGVYSVKFTAQATINGQNITGELVKKLVVVNKNVVWSFEGDDPFLGGSRYEGLEDAQVYEKADGSHGLVVTPSTKSWAGWNYPDGLSLGTSTTKLQFKIYADREISQLRVQVKNAQGLWTAFARVDVTTEEQTVVVDFGEDINNLKAFIIYSDVDLYGKLYVDDIGLVPELGVSITQDGSVYVGDTVEFAVVNVEGALSGLTVEFAVYGSEEWATLTPTAGQYSFLAEQMGTYLIRYSGNLQLEDLSIPFSETKAVSVVDTTTLFSFEGSDPFLTAQGITKYYGLGGVQMIPYDKEDGTRGLKIIPWDSWAGFTITNGFTFGDGVETSQLYLTISADKAIAKQEFQVKVGNSWISAYADITTEAKTIILDFGVNVNGLTNFIIKAVQGAYGEMYVDNIGYYVAEDSGIATTINEAVKLGDAVSFSIEAEAGELQNVTVEYAAYGDDQWTALTGNAGVYSFTPSAAGTYLVRYSGTHSNATGVIPFMQTESVSVIETTTIFSFEGDDPFLESQGVTKYYGLSNVQMMAYKKSDGTKGLKVIPADSWAGFTIAEGLTLGNGEEVTKLYLTISADTAITNHAFEVKVGTSWVSAFADITTEPTRIVLDFGVNINGLTNFIVQAVYGSYLEMYIDDIGYVIE